jgi:hypothetical protein
MPFPGNAKIQTFFRIDKKISRVVTRNRGVYARGLSARQLRRKLVILMEVVYVKD